MSRFKWLGFLAFVFVGVALWWWMVSESGPRRPASEKHFPKIDFEIRDNGGNQTIRSIKLRMLQEFRWEEVASGWRLNFGAFRLLGRSKTELACERFSQIKVTLVAAEVFVSGEAPRFVITSPCQIEDGFIALPPLNFERLKNEVKTKTEWTDDLLLFEAHLLDEEWFTQWQLARVELIPAQEGPVIEIDGVEIQAVRPGAELLTTQ